VVRRVERKELRRDFVPFISILIGEVEGVFDYLGVEMAV
jgi:hypothetical protein